MRHDGQYVDPGELDPREVGWVADGVGPRQAMTDELEETQTRYHPEDRRQVQQMMAREADAADV